MGKSMSRGAPAVVAYDRVIEDQGENVDVEGASIAPPKDARSLAYVIMFLQGIAMLFPWNAFITAKNFYELEFKDTPFGNTFENFFSLAYMSSNLLTYLISFLWVHKVSERSRIIVPSLITVVALGVATALCYIESLDPTVYFGITITLVIASGACAAILQGAVFALSASLEHDGMYSQAVMSGQGLAGAIVAVSSIVTSASFPPGNNGGVRNSAFLYFLIATVIVIVATGGILVFDRLPFAQHYRRRMKRVKASYRHQPDRANGDVSASSPAAPYTPGASSVASPGSEFPDSPADIVMLTPGTFQKKWGDDRHEAEADKEISLVHVGKKLKPYLFCVCFVFVVTLAMFPGIVVNLVSETPKKARFFDDLFIPFNILVFNMGDLFSRLAAGWWRPKWMTAKVLVILSTARILFIPAFLFCNLVIYKKHELPVVFASDVWPIAFMAFFSFTNGYIVSVSMMNGPESVPIAERPSAGTILSFFMNTGLFGGSCLSFVILHFLCGCNPLNPPHV